MTVSYTGEVATCSGFGCFFKLLFRWKGSIYKLVWPDLLLFLSAFFSLSILYRFILTEEQQIVFAKVAQYCENYGNLIPISFVLGFYVTIVVGRWWDQYRTIPWTDSVALFVSANIIGNDEKGRVMRRTIMRYCCLTLTMTFTKISPRVKKRFPTLDHLVEAGLLLENEKDIIQEINRNVPMYSKQWIPIVWASGIVTRARREGKIKDDFAVKTILDELNEFRAKCGLLIQYDWISVPLVYTQVVTLAVYAYFVSCIMGRQWLGPLTTLSNKTNKVDGLDLIFPVFTLLQFFFYMGWLKVAESLLNPFGDDDDDFELNWLVDRNLQVSYLIVDEMHHEHPELLKDQYWDEVFPSELPYTVASEAFREGPPAHSTDKITLSKHEGEIVSPPSVKLDEMSESGGIGRRASSIMMSKGGSFSRQRTASVRSNASASTLAESISGKLSRAASITSVFKRIFTREHSHKELHSPSGESRGLEGLMGSTGNVQRKVLDDVIPELDENMTTIISMRPERKPPTVQEIFGKNPDDTTVENHPETDRRFSTYSITDEEMKPLRPPSSLFIPKNTEGEESEEDVGIFMKLTRPSTSSESGTSAASVVPSTATSPMHALSTPTTSTGSTSLPSTSAPLSSAPSSSSSVKESPEEMMGNETFDESMDDLKTRKKSGGSSKALGPMLGGNITDKLAKTLGLGGKMGKGEGDAKSEVRLLTDVSMNKDEDED